MTNGSSQGLFVIVSVVIFGIFVLISYLLFGDKMKTSLASIFDTSIEQFDTTGGDGVTLREPVNVLGHEEDGYIIAKIRDGNGSDITDVWVKALIESDNTLTIESSNNINSTFSFTNKETTSTTRNIVGGSLVIPDTINNKVVTKIGDRAFMFSKFSGDFSANTVTQINVQSFAYSKFSGTFHAPNLLTVLGKSFIDSEFTGNFTSNKLEKIDYDAFYTSKFTGRFNVPNVTTIGSSAFKQSLFSNSLDLPNVTIIGYSAFENTQFSNVITPKLSSLGNNAIKLSDNTYYKLP